MKLPITIKSPVQASNRHPPASGPAILVLCALHSAEFKKVCAVVTEVVIAHLRTFLGVASGSWPEPGAKIIVHTGAVVSLTIYATGAAAAGYTAGPGVPGIVHAVAIEAAI